MLNPRGSFGSISLILRVQLQLLLANMRNENSIIKWAISFLYLTEINTVYISKLSSQPDNISLSLSKYQLGWAWGVDSSKDCTSFNEIFESQRDLNPINEIRFLLSAMQARLPPTPLFF